MTISILANIKKYEKIVHTENGLVPSRNAVQKRKIAIKGLVRCNNTNENCK
jgi:phosphoenolpyruvate synthase/pyruvate phosphate dikinase